MKKMDPRNFRIGIDLGGTKIEGLVMAPDHKEVVRTRIATEREKGYETILEKIMRLYKELRAKVPAGALHTLGIATPGALSRRTGLLKNSNTVCMNGKPLKNDLEKMLGRKLALQNDANCFAQAEAVVGAGRGKDRVFGVIMGTGCGGGIVERGTVIAGLQDIAGEWGHMAIDPAGPLCYCGSRGCVETFVSGGGLERSYQNRFSEAVTAEAIVSRFREGEADAVAVMEEFFKNFGRALANLIHVLDPDIVVLGGGLSNVEELYTAGIDWVRKFIFSDSLETPIVKNKMGDSAGVIGAALIGI